MISDPTVVVTCDVCGYSDEFGLTATARRGYDERNLKGDIEGAGWIQLSENKHLCPECVKEEENEDVS